MDPKFEIGQIVELKSDYIEYRKDLPESKDDTVRGIVVSSRTQSVHVMDRPKKIIDTVRYVLLVNGRDVYCEEEGILGVV